MTRATLLVLLACVGCADATASNYFNQGRYTATKTTDQVFTSSTLADVSGMWFPVAVGATYRFQFDVFFKSASASVGIGLSLSVPTFSQFGAIVTLPQTTDGPAGLFEGSITASDDTVLETQVEAANTDYTGMIRGVLLPTANGMIYLRARNETGATAVTVRAGSLGVMETYPL